MSSTQALEVLCLQAAQHGLRPRYDLAIMQPTPSAMRSCQHGASTVQTNPHVLRVCLPDLRLP